MGDITEDNIDHRKITLANFENSIAGVVEGKLFPVMRL
jgi:hypothetical protein